LNLFYISFFYFQYFVPPLLFMVRKLSKLSDVSRIYPPGYNVIKASRIRLSKDNELFGATQKAVAPVDY
ncbi:MAG: hypothetical protein PHN80_12690, partial [Hespellia sp.]|nr:hypothetical protein [Hespellia sp.]